MKGSEASNNLLKPSTKSSLNNLTLDPKESIRLHMEKMRTIEERDNSKIKNRQFSMLNPHTSNQLR